MLDYYDREGKPISMGEYLRLMRDDDYRRVALDTVGPYTVSTVWLGVDHGFAPGHPAIIFETMVFSADEFYDRERPPGLRDMDARRYCTEAEARAGHDEFLLLIRATLQQELPTDPATAGPERPSRPGSE